VAIRKISCASAAGRYERDRVCPIASRCAWVCIGGRSGNCPFLKVGAHILILNNNSFSLNKQRQKDVNIVIVPSQMADIDAGRANLCGIVP
jgi:hypothetical protein